MRTDIKRVGGRQRDGNFLMGTDLPPEVVTALGISGGDTLLWKHVGDDTIVIDRIGGRPLMSTVYDANHHTYRVGMPKPIRDMLGGGNFLEWSIIDGMVTARVGRERDPQEMMDELLRRNNIV